ncbi:hypothetical protein D3C87_1334930 [compost metagenome]
MAEIVRDRAATCGHGGSRDLQPALRAQNLVAGNVAALRTRRSCVAIEKAGIGHLPVEIDAASINENIISDVNIQKAEVASDCSNILMTGSAR